MHQELRLHGHIDDNIEYFVTVAARDAGRCHFYETREDGLRIFAPGNEIVLDRTGLTHWGNGGSFCEYMYGVEQPVADVLKNDVANRLVLFGAAVQPDGELRFSNETSGRIPYDQIFLKVMPSVTAFSFSLDRFMEHSRPSRRISSVCSGALLNVHRESELRMMRVS